MSLLMQALKKAEHAKQKSGGGLADDAPIDKEGGKAPEGALSLSPKEDMPAVVPASPAVKVDPPDVAMFGLPASQLLEPSAPEIALTSYPAVDLVASETLAVPPVPFQDPTNSTPLTGIGNDFAPRVPPAVADAPISETHVPRPVAPRITPAETETARLAEQKLLSAQKKAKSVFSAKSAPRSRTASLLVLGGLVIGGMLGGLGFLYWKSQELEGGSVAVRNPASAAPEMPVVPAAVVVPVVVPELAQSTVEPLPRQETAPQAAAVSPQTALPVAAATPVPPVSAAPAKPAMAPPAESTPRPAIPVSAAVPTERAPRINPAPAQLSRSTNPMDSAETNAIQIRQSSTGSQVNPALDGAYQSFIAGNSVAARQQYQRVLQQDPTNRDALLGMAAISLNQRDASQAGSFYGKLLELDPTDAEAIAGLTSLQQGDPVQSESRLKRILAQSPNSSAILFALGNLYAQQSRWADAQQVYFRAFVSAPSNADYAFNLAVSLDRLSQAKSAREYYVRALDLGQRGSGNFSRANVQKRIKELDTPVED